MSEKTKITNVETVEFPSTMDGAIITTKKVAMIVNAFFGRIFSDYKGCYVRVDQGNSNSPQQDLNMYHPVQLDLYFDLNTNVENEGEIKAFHLIGNKDSAKKESNPGRMNYVERATHYNAAIIENKVSDITQDAVDIMYGMLWYEIRKVVPSNCTPKHFNDRGISVETYITENGERKILGVIRYVDVNEVFKLIYGATKDNGKCYYQTNPVKPVLPPTMISNNMPMINEKWLLYVMRLNEKSLRDVVGELGTSTTVGPNIEVSRA